MCVTGKWKAALNFTLMLPWCGLQGGFSAYILSFSLLTSGPGKALDKLKLMRQQVHCYEECHLNHRWYSRLRQGHLLLRQSPGKAGDSVPSMSPQPSRHLWSASGECVHLYQGGCPLSLHVMGGWCLHLLQSLGILLNPVWNTEEHWIHFCEKLVYVSECVCLCVSL